MRKSIIKATTIRSLMIIVLIGLFFGSAFGFYSCQDHFRQRATELKLNNSETSIASTNKITSLLIPETDYETFVKKDLDIYTNKISPNLVKEYKFDTDTTANADPQANGIVSRNISIVFNNPVNYNDLIKFIKAIETNIPKMNIEDLNIKNGPSNEVVIVDPITVKVYIK